MGIETLLFVQVMLLNQQKIVLRLGCGAEKGGEPSLGFEAVGVDG